MSRVPQMRQDRILGQIRQAFYLPLLRFPWLQVVRKRGDLSQCYRVGIPTLRIGRGVSQIFLI